ncbi:hypothetical protein EJ06DRAFT_560484 [Trichodelitschia bisporula]|uniref:Uncharacterized protein n=1 Tax=Trichodelitschia bisporula TaxID=703511 RepID=A0A6G1HIR8_9PEZI|nr:hypothetical protein EJ06DRAFT_560484 [Trichodelitschia bisporula]
MHTPLLLTLLALWALHALAIPQRPVPNFSQRCVNYGVTINDGGGACHSGYIQVCDKEGNACTPANRRECGVRTPCYNTTAPDGSLTANCCQFGSTEQPCCWPSSPAEKVRLPAKAIT